MSVREQVVRALEADAVSNEGKVRAMTMLYVADAVMAIAKAIIEAARQLGRIADSVGRR